MVAGKSLVCCDCQLAFESADTDCRGAPKEHDEIAQGTATTGASPWGSQEKNPSPERARPLCPNPSHKFSFTWYSPRRIAKRFCLMRSEMSFMRISAESCTIFAAP